MSLPTRLRDARRFINTLDLRQIESSIAEEARAQLIIVGPVNSGKSTLFNQLKGKKISAVSAVPGTTKEVIAEQFGPFWLIDTPGLDELAGEGRAALALEAVQRADVAILVLDVGAGIRESDRLLYRELRAQGLPVVVALNKIDLIRKDLKGVHRANKQDDHHRPGQERPRDVQEGLEPGSTIYAGRLVELLRDGPQAGKQDQDHKGRPLPDIHNHDRGQGPLNCAQEVDTGQTEELDDGIDRPPAHIEKHTPQHPPSDDRHHHRGEQQ